MVGGMRATKTEQFTAEILVELDEYSDDVYDAFAGLRVYDPAIAEELEDWKIASVKITEHDSAHDLLTLTAVVAAEISYEVPEGEDVPGDDLSPYQGLAAALMEYTDCPPDFVGQLSAILIEGLSKESRDS